MTTAGTDSDGNASKRTGIAAFSSHSDGRKNSVLLTKRSEVACALDTGLGASRPQPTRSAHRARRAHRRPHDADPCLAARHVIGRLLDLSHIWRTCVADLLADHA